MRVREKDKTISAHAFFRHFQTAVSRSVSKINLQIRRSLHVYILLLLLQSYYNNTRLWGTGAGGEIERGGGVKHVPLTKVLYTFASL